MLPVFNENPNIMTGNELVIEQVVANAGRNAPTLMGIGRDSFLTGQSVAGTPATGQNVIDSGYDIWDSLRYYDLVE